MDVVSADEATGWDAFVDRHPYAWFTHRRHWSGVVDAAAGARDLSFAVARDGRLLAVVPCTLAASGPAPILVSGVLEPAGALPAPDLPPEAAADLWRVVDAQLAELARQTGATAALLRAPVLGRLGQRPAYAGCPPPGTGWRTQPRGFYCMDLTQSPEELFRAVSTRVRGQINSASRDCEVREVESAADLTALYHIYHRHAAGKGTQVLPRDHLEQVAEAGTARVVTLLAWSAGTPVGFAIALCRGVAATLFAWGCDPDLRRGQVSKFLVWRSLMHLRATGFTIVEYGGAMPQTSAFAGLTEFYRRLGGEVLTAHWSLRRFDA